MGLGKKERKKLIGKISMASGVGEYSLEAKMTDEEVIEAANHLDVFLLIKDANRVNLGIYFIRGFLWSVFWSLFFDLLGRLYEYRLYIFSGHN